MEVPQRKKKRNLSCLILLSKLMMRLSLLFTTSLFFPDASGFAPFPRNHCRTEITLEDVSNDKVLYDPLTSGSTCALVTPFLPSGDVDIPSLRNILQYQLDSGTDNLCILGTTGEASVVSMKERSKILTIAVEMCKGKMPVLAGITTIDPKEAKEMTKQAIEIGCDASLVVTPYYVTPPQRALIDHFTSLADLGLPVFISNIPGRAKNDISEESIGVCAEHENIVGLLDQAGDLSRVKKMRNLVGDDFFLYTGHEETSVEFVMLGGDGCISVTANCAPREMHEIMMATLRGDRHEAEEINDKLKLLHKRLHLETNPIPVKWAMKRMGFIQYAHCRPPLDEMDPGFEADLEGAIKAAGLSIAYEEDMVKEIDNSLRSETKFKSQVLN